MNAVPKRLLKGIRGLLEVAPSLFTTCDRLSPSGFKVVGRRAFITRVGCPTDSDNLEKISGSGPGQPRIQEGELGMDRVQVRDCLLRGPIPNLESAHQEGQTGET
jgi:hypothetical protein